MTTILFELGTEELPPKSLKTLRDSLSADIKAELAAANLAYQDFKAFATPRRLAVQIIGIDDKQPDSQKRFDGPAVNMAYNEDGTPSKALLGFMKGQGIELGDLSTFNAGKVEKVCYFKNIQGKPTTELIGQIIQHALDKLPIAKRMRSGASKDEFVRPVQWLVLMADDKVIDTTIQGLTSGNQSRGHRFHAPDFFVIHHADSYEALLKEHMVIADFDERQAMISRQVQAISDELGASAIVPADLLDEVTALVELPVALKASFPERFLAVPQEALISTMQADQKYFCLTDNTGKLLPYFIFISNINSKDPTQVISGNEKVVRPRLADAEFFFMQDQKQPLIDFADKLKERVFQEKLGTLWDKSERIAKLSAFIAVQIGADVEPATRAALLSKVDLTTTLVGEFPELQGIAGTKYAHLSGEQAEVADAIYEQYLPKFSGDVLPQSQIGLCLALADRLDTLVGIFGIGQAPTGSKDPFSLRRASIGILRILIEKRLKLNLVALVEQAILGYGDKLDNFAKAFTDTMEFINARYRAMYTEQGVAVDSIMAVQAINPHMPMDFDERIHAVQAFRALPTAKVLAEANKRVANILAKADTQISDTVDTDLLTENAEIALYAAVQSAQTDVSPMQQVADYQGILERLSELAEPLTNFFDNVMVNANDERLKTNRLALLQQVRTLFLSVADIGELQIEK